MQEGLNAVWFGLGACVYSCLPAALATVLAATIAIVAPRHASFFHGNFSSETNCGVRSWKCWSPSVVVGLHLDAMGCRARNMCVSGSLVLECIGEQAIASECA